MAKINLVLLLLFYNSASEQITETLIYKYSQCLSQKNSKWEISRSLLQAEDMFQAASRYRKVFIIVSLHAVISLDDT